MATLTINSRNHGKQTFFMPDNGGYVRLESDGKSGILARQICDGGDYMGNTISATESSFERTVRKWHKARLAAIREYGMDY